MICTLLTVALLAPPQAMATADSAAPSQSLVAAPGSWSASNGPTLGVNITSVSLVESAGDAKAMTAVDVNNGLWLSTHDGTSWGAFTSIASDIGATSGLTQAAAYGASSGRLLLVYRKASSSLVFFRTYHPDDSPALSYEDWYDVSLATAPDRVLLAPKPGSSEAVLVAAAGSSLRAAQWDGTAFSDTESLDTGFTGTSGMLAASWDAGDAAVLWANNAGVTPEGAFYDGTDWTTATGLPTFADPITRLELASCKNALLLSMITTGLTEDTSGGSSTPSTPATDGPVVYAGGSFDYDSGCTITGDVVEGQSGDMPPEPSPSGSSSGDLDIGDSQSASPSPGRFDTIDMSKDSVLNLVAGDYFFDTWEEAGDRATVNADTSAGAVRLVIENSDLKAKKEFVAQVTAGSNAFEIHVINGNFDIAKDATVSAGVVVYNGNIEFEKDATINGYLLASGNVKFKKDCTLTAPSFGWPGSSSTPGPDPDPVYTETYALHTAVLESGVWSAPATLSDELASINAASAGWEASGAAAVAVWQDTDETTLRYARFESGSWSPASDTADLDGTAQRLLVRPGASATDTTQILGSVLAEGTAHPLAGYLAYSLDHMHLDDSVTPNGLTGEDEGHAMPTPPSLSHGSTKVEVDDETLDLAPGAYGELELKEDAIVNLVAGDYIFEKNKKGKKDVTINADTTAGPVRIIFNSGKVEFEDNFTLTNTGPGPVEVHTLGGKFKAKDNAYANASFISYVKEVEFGDDSVVVGHLIAMKHVKLDDDSTLDPPTWDFPFTDGGSGSTSVTALYGFTSTAGSMSSQTLVIDDWEESHALPFDLSWARPTSGLRVTSWREVPSYDENP